jgi:hypothetical protein
MKMVLVIVRRSRGEAALLVRPFLAAFCLHAMSTNFHEARQAGLLGARTGFTLVVWVSSWAFAALAHAAVSRAASEDRTSVPAALRAYAFAVSAAALWLAIHMWRYGLIGLRTWRW